MKPWVWPLVLVLAVLHQDFWLWDDATLVFGFLPAGLAYHAGYSVVVALFWFAVVRFGWPALDGLDADSEPAHPTEAPGGAAS